MLLPILVSTALSAENPEANVSCTNTKDGKCINVNGEHISFENDSGIILVGAGKASVRFAADVLNLINETILPDDNVNILGTVVTKYGHSSEAAQEFTDSLRNWGICVREAAHPCPDANSVAASREILEKVSSATPKDTVFFILTGGASSLLSLPADGLTLEDVQGITNQLLRCGASIHEINIVRKHCSGIAGGHLARVCRAKRLVTFVISDVIGDKLDVIGSGPTVADPSTFQDALNVLRKYSLLPASDSSVDPRTFKDRNAITIRNVAMHLELGACGRRPETPKVLPDTTLHTICILRSLKHASRAVCSVLQDVSVPSVLLTSELEGDAPVQAIRLAMLLYLDQLRRMLEKVNLMLKKRTHCEQSSGEWEILLEGLLFELSWDNNVSTNCKTRSGMRERYEKRDNPNRDMNSDPQDLSRSSMFVQRCISRLQVVCHRMISDIIKHFGGDVSAFRPPVHRRSEEEEAHQHCTGNGPYAFVIGGETTVRLGQFAQSAPNNTLPYSGKGGRNLVFPLYFSLAVQEICNVSKDDRLQWTFENPCADFSDMKFNNVKSLMKYAAKYLFSTFAHLYNIEETDRSAGDGDLSSISVFRTFLNSMANAFTNVKWNLMSLATDGTDGPTDRAGAIATSNTLYGVKEKFPESDLAETYLEVDSSLDYWELVDKCSISDSTCLFSDNAPANHLPHKNVCCCDRKFEEKQSDKLFELFSSLDTNRNFSPHRVVIGGMRVEVRGDSIEDDRKEQCICLTKSVGGSIRTGPTNTNVCDVIVLLVTSGL